MVKDFIPYCLGAWGSRSKNVLSHDQEQNLIYYGGLPPRPVCPPDFH